MLQPGPMSAPSMTQCANTSVPAPMRALRTRHTGPMRTFVFRPQAAGRYPGVIFYSEVFQVTGPVRRIATLIAGHGFVVAVPEIWHEFEAPGTALPYDQAGGDRGNALKKEKEVAAIDADTRAILDFLRSL